MHQWWKFKLGAPENPCWDHVIADMLRSGKFFPDTKWIMPKFGEGMTPSKVSTMMKIACYPERVTVEDVNYIFFDDHSHEAWVRRQVRVSTEQHYNNVQSEPEHVNNVQSEPVEVIDLTRETSEEPRGEAEEAFAEAYPEEAFAEAYNDLRRDGAIAVSYDGRSARIDNPEVLPTPDAAMARASKRRRVVIESDEEEADPRNTHAA